MQYSKYCPGLCPAQGSCQSTVFCQVRVVAAMPQLGETELLLSFPQILHSSEINSQALHQRLALLYSLALHIHLCWGMEACFHFPKDFLPIFIVHLMAIWKCINCVLFINILYCRYMATFWVFEYICQCIYSLWLMTDYLDLLSIQFFLFLLLVLFCRSIPLEFLR